MDLMNSNSLRIERTCSRGIAQGNKDENFDPFDWAMITQKTWSSTYQAPIYLFTLK